MITAGLGCRKACPADAITTLLQQAAHQANVQIEALAAPHFKQTEPGLLQAARTLNLPLRFISEQALTAAQPFCPTQSETARKATGHASIAEACALAATNGRLILPRIGNAQATCALAQT